MKSVWGLLLVALMVVKGSEALIHELTLDQDSRGIFKIESFGFSKQGSIVLNLSDIKVNVGDKTASGAEALNYGMYGFHMRISNTEVYSLDKSNCQNLIKGANTETEIKLLVNDDFKDGKYERTVDVSTEGLYTVYFVTCPKEDASNLKLSFKLKIEMFNVESGTRNYLSTGQSALPTIYFLLFATHLVLCGVWGRVIKRNWPTVNKLHLLMTALLVIKTLTMLWQSLEVRQMKIAGSSGGWGVVYYIFSFLRGMMLFTVILLIGTGWAFLKPFLNDREKKVFMFVIPLQLFANIALIIVGESSPGSQEWVTWKDIFAMVDLICCAAIIIPIMWSIKHLRQAAQSDGKAAKSLKMLQLFRSFYLMVIAYIYFSRIIVTLLEPVIPYTVAWIAPFLNEIAAVVLYFTTGYWFRPGEDNPYFKIATSEEEEVAAVALEKMETALDDDLARLVRAVAAVTRTGAALLRDFPREFAVQPDNKIGETLFLAFAKSKAPKKNVWLRLRNHDALKERPILFKHSLPMWSRLRYEVEDEEEFERRPLYKYHVRQHHLGIFDRLQTMSFKSALPIPGGDVIEERGDDLLTQELNFYNPKRLKKLYNHLNKVELRPMPDYDFDFLLEPLEAGLPDDHLELRNEEYEDDKETGTARTPETEEGEEEMKMGTSQKDKEGGGGGAAEPKNMMSIDEAKKILEAKVTGEEDGKEIYDMEDLEKKYKLLFSLNDPAGGGSMYLALKIQAAYDKLRGKEVGVQASKKNKDEEKKDDRVEKLKAEHEDQMSKFNPNIKKVRIPNPFFIPQFWQDMNVEEKKLAEHVLNRLEPEMEWRENMYEDGKRRKPQKIPEIHRDYY